MQGGPVLCSLQTWSWMCAIPRGVSRGTRTGRERCLLSTHGACRGHKPACSACLMPEPTIQTRLETVTSQPVQRRIEDGSALGPSNPTHCSEWCVMAARLVSMISVVTTSKLKLSGSWAIRWRSGPFSTSGRLKVYLLLKHTCSVAVKLRHSKTPNVAVDPIGVGGPQLLLGAFHQSSHAIQD